MLDESEFLSPHGLRALSAAYRDRPYELVVDGRVLATVDYEPAESSTGLFGGNSNWRGPIWFPVNYVVIEALDRYHAFFGDALRVEHPTGSGRMMNLGEVSLDLSRRLVSLFLLGRRRTAALLRRRRALSARPGVARLAPVPRVLPRRQRPRPRGVPPDRLDRAGRRSRGASVGVAALTAIVLGRQVLGSLREASAREWLLTDGLGGYAMGTAGGLETRRYHGLLAVAAAPPGGRMMALVALDPVIVRGDARIPLATHEWRDGAIAPAGHVHLESFAIEDGVPRWRWSIGDVVLERRLAMARGRPLVAAVHRLLRADGPVRLELEPLCTWRDVHGERHGPVPPAVEITADGFAFEGRYRLSGPGFVPEGAWFAGLRHREEADRGLADHEDLWQSGPLRRRAARRG